MVARGGVVWLAEGAGYKPTFSGTCSAKSWPEMNRLWSSLWRPRAVLVSRYTSPSGSKLPWSVVKPYGSIRVNLTEAYSEGWKLQESFSSLLQRKFFYS